MAQPHPPWALSGQVSWNFCLREADEKAPSLTCEHFIAAAPAFTTLWPPKWITSLFPAKGEVKREVLKVWLAWPGNQTSLKSLVRSLVQGALSPGRPNGMLAAVLSCRHRCLRMNMVPHAMHL